MTNKIISSILTAAAAIAALSLAACDDDKPDDATIFPTDSPERDAFDQWLLENYTYPYNIEVKYKMEDIESDMSYNLTPADSAKSAKLSIIIKYLWLDAYAEVVGPDFVKSNVPRVIHLIGSPAYNTTGTFVLGTAEGGYKVTLYMVNSLTDAMLQDYDMLNTYYFHTMHHEFTHILNQKKPYDSQFDKITTSEYVSGDWYDIEDSDAHKQGFVSGYAMSEAREDFAEMMAYYVTETPEAWQAILDEAGDNVLSENITARQAIEQKLTIIRNYMQDYWDLDIDALRDAVLHRANELSRLDLETLK